MRLVKLVTIVTLCSTAAGANAFTLIGDIIEIKRIIPSLSFTFGPFFTTVVEGPSDSVAISTGNNNFVNPEATSIIITFGPQGGSGGGIPDHQIVISDLDWIGDPGAYLLSASASGNVPGFDPSDLSWTADSVTLHHGNYDWVGGEEVIIELNPVPEPATMVALGLGMLGLLRRHKRSR